MAAAMHYAVMLLSAARVTVVTLAAIVATGLRTATAATMRVPSAVIMPIGLTATMPVASTSIMPTGLVATMPITTVRRAAIVMTFSPVLISLATAAKHADNGRPTHNITRRATIIPARRGIIAGGGVRITG